MLSARTSLRLCANAGHPMPCVIGSRANVPLWPYDGGDGGEQTPAPGAGGRPLLAHPLLTPWFPGKPFGSQWC